MDDNQISNDDIDMINDMTPRKNMFSNDITDKDSSKMDSLDDSLISDSDSKTPGEILDEFCVKLDEVNTTLPDSVINYYMKKAGFVVNDPKLVKIISIASQKFISEIVNDVMQHHKQKSKSVTTTGSGANAGGSNASGSGNQTAGKSKAGAAGASNAASNAANAAGQNISPLTLTLEDLSNVLADYGINVKKPYYFM